VEEDTLGRETLNFMINTFDLGLNKENLVCGRLESSVIALKTTTTITESHVFRRKNGGRECTGRGRP